jgi:class 3 adenylate cyclase
MMPSTLSDGSTG